MGIVNNSNEKVSKQVADWVNTNLTNNAVEKCASTLFSAIQKIFVAPFDIAMNLVEIIQDKKYSKYIVTIWGIIGSSVMLASLILTLLDNSYPFNSWGLGVAIASFIVIWIAKHPLTITIESSLSKEIEEEIARLDTLPTIAADTVDNLAQSQLYIDDSELLDDNDEELLEDDEEELLEDDDDEELLEDDDEELLDDIVDVESEGIQDSTAEDLYNDILGDESVIYENSVRDIDPSLRDDILDFLNNKDM